MTDAFRDTISSLVDGGRSRPGGARVHRFCIQQKQERTGQAADPRAGKDLREMRAIRQPRRD